MKTSRISQVFLVIVLAMALLVIVQMFTAPKAEEISLSELKGLIQSGAVSKVEIVQASQIIRGEYSQSSTKVTEGNFTHFEAAYSERSLDALYPLMDNFQVSYAVVKPSIWDSLFSAQALMFILLLGLPIIFFIWLLNRQMQGGGNNQAMNFGKSRARVATEGKQRIMFKDVAGVDEAVEELNEVVDFLKDPKKYEALGAEIPKGVLMVGPPGCGKTYLAKAVAGEANVPFFYISGSDFVEMFVGVGASRVRDLFDQAKRRAPCLVFIDELDAVGRQRGTGLGGTHDEREQTLNQMLVEMDGFEPNSGIIVLAATNRPDVLDPALLRPGRFDRRIVVDAPDLKGREEILRIYVKDQAKPGHEDIDLAELAQRTPGFSGADLKNTVNEAALLAARDGSKIVSRDFYYEAIDRVVAGPERKSRIINEREKQIIAYHELGHAIVSHELLADDPVHKISILPRGQALGYTLNFPNEDRFLISRDMILKRVSMTLGGRAAEEIVFDDITTGAQNDLERSTQLVRDIVTKYGMSEELGPIQFGNQHDNPFLGRSIYEDRNYSDEIAFRIDKEVKRIVSDCYSRAKGVLDDLRLKMDYIAEKLIDREYLNRDEFEELMKQPVPTDWVPRFASARDYVPPKDGDGSQGLTSSDPAEPAPAPVG